MKKEMPKIKKDIAKKNKKFKIPKYVQNIAHILTIITLVFTLIFVIDTVLYLNGDHQTKSDCNKYQYFVKSFLFYDVGKCYDDDIIKIKNCSNYDDNVCVEWTYVYSFNKTRQQ